MFPSAAAAIPSALIKICHETDRNLYSFLTDDLLRDPLESMQAMALWLWLERIGFHNVVKNISSLPHFLINDISAEAIYCINCLTKMNILTPPSERKNELPLTQSLLGNQMLPNFFYKNRGSAIIGIGKAMSEVCGRALTDLLQQAMARKRARQLEEDRIAMTFLEPRFSLMNINNFERINPRVNNLSAAVDRDNRTMFVTFSRGYPVPESDIWDFFYLNYGDCIESIRMQEVHNGEQSLYVRIVFNMPDVIPAVLNGKEKAKFTIKGRHIWMRKFVSKHQKPISPTGTQPQRPVGSGVGSSRGSFRALSGAGSSRGSFRGL